MFPVRAKRAVRGARVALAAFVVAQGCSDQGPSQGPAHIGISSGGAPQSAIAGSGVQVIPSVLVTNSGGSPVANAKVTFAVASGGGSVNPATAVTNASGIASTYWTLGLVAGPNALTATIEGLAPVTFNATGVAGTATKMIAEPGTTPQAVPAGAVVPVPPAVRVTDANGNPVAGVKVVFWTGDGTIVPASVITDANGRAAATSWTVEKVAGPKGAVAYMGV